MAIDKSIKRLLIYKHMDKLSKGKSIKLTNTVSGQREILREHRNKINEIIDWINSHQEWVQRKKLENILND